MAQESSYLHLARPLGPTMLGAQPSTAPLNVIIQPQTIFSILDHALRRQVDQSRVIGTLLGTRSEDGTEVTVSNCFAYGHNENRELIEVDFEHAKAMLSLHLKANPREVVVGWYATSSELDHHNALLQNHYSGPAPDGTAPHSPIHLTLNTESGKDIESKTYISTAIGSTPERLQDSCLFIPVPHEIKYGEAEKSGLELISAAKDKNERTAGVITDIEALERAIEDVLAMLERVSEYVSSVLDEESPPSSALGQFLMNALALAPKVDPADIERDFNNHLQDVLVVSYLANTIRTQIDLSNRLATAALIIGGEGLPETGTNQQTDRKQGGQRGGKGRGGQQRGEPRESRE